MKIVRNIRLGEVLALVQEGFAEDLRQRVGEAVAEVQPRSLR